MAVKNNPVLGYVTCKKCGGRASVHMVSRGNGRRGMLYTRNCDCKPACNQSPKNDDQQYWRDNTETVENYMALIPEDIGDVFAPDYQAISYETGRPIGQKVEAEAVEIETETETEENPDNPSIDAGSGGGESGGFLRAAGGVTLFLAGVAAVVMGVRS